MGPEGPSGVQTLFFGAIFGHFEPLLALLGLLWPFLAIWVGGNGSKWVRTPYSWGKMGWGVKIGGPSGVQTLFWGHIWPF